MVTADADQCQSPDSSFVICLSGDTRTHGRTENGLQDSRGTAGTPDMGLIEGDEQNSDPPIPPTVTMRSPTVSAVVAAAAKTAKPAAAATTPSSRLPAAKVPKKARNSTPTAETLRQKGTSTRADPANVVAPGAKPPAVAVAAASPGSGTEENKAPSPRSGRKPIGLPPLKRARTVSAQPASCGKQAAPAPATVTVTAATKSKLPAFAPNSGAKRAHSSQSPIGLGGAALPLPPPKRARTTSTSPSAVVGGDLIKNDQEKQKRKTNKVPVPASAPAADVDVDVLVGRKKKGNLKTSLQNEEEQQLDVPLNKNNKKKDINSNAATAPAPAAASEQQPQQQQPQRESRRQRSIATKKTVTVVPEWVQRANEAPQVNALLLSAVEKLKPLAADGASGVDSGAWPAWQIAGGKDKKIAAQHVDVDNAKINVAEEQQGRKLRQRQDVVAKTAPTATTAAIVDGKRILMNYKSKALSIPGWEAVLQTVDVAPREYEDAETVAEILEQGASKRLKYNLQREYTALLKNTNNIANNDRSGFALGSPGSPGMLAQGSSSQHVLNRADASLYRQGFGVSEFAARVSIAASGLTAEAVEKESLVQRAKRVVHGTRSTILKNTSAIVPNAAVCAVENDKEEKEEEEEKGENASKRQSGERGGGIAEKMKGRKKPKVLLHFSTIPEVPDAEDEQKRQQQQEPRAPFALGQAISNAVAVELRSRSALLGRGGGFNPDGLIRNKDGGIRKKPGRKPQDPNTNNNGRGGGGKKKAGGRGGGAHTAGTSSRQRNTTPAPVEKELETANTERIKPPPTVWPRVEQQFLSKGAKYENSINLNDLARSSTFNGSGLDTQLWNKLWKQQAKAAANKVPPTV